MSEVIAMLDAGAQLVGSVLVPHGFVWVPGRSGIGHPGDFASGAFVRGDRRLELHFRHGSLGLVTYHIGVTVISHVDLMRHTGHAAEAQYPGFSSEPLDQFKHLAHDLEHFGTDFMLGDGSTLVSARHAATEYAKIRGFGRLP